MDPTLDWLLESPDLDELLPQREWQEAQESEPSEAPSSPRSVSTPHDQHDERKRDKQRTRRRRNRECMARSRAEARESMKVLTAQRDALARILQQVLVHNKPIQHSSQWLVTPLQRHQVRFTELVRLRGALLLEQHELTNSIVDRQQRLDAMQRMLGTANMLHPSMAVTRSQDDERAEFHGVRSHGQKDGGPLQDDSASTRTGRWLQFLDDEPPLFYEFLTAEASAGVIFQGLTLVQDVYSALSQPSSSVWSMPCLGWTAQRMRELDVSCGRPCLRMRCSKRIPRTRATLEMLEDKTWKQVSDPACVAPSTRANVTARVVQQFNDDTVVMLRNTKDTTRCTNFRDFSLRTRMWSPDGKSALVAVFMIDRETTSRQSPSIASGSSASFRVDWLKHGAATFRFTHVAEDETEIEFTSFVDCGNETLAAHLMLGNCSALLNWERAVIPLNLLG